jgi:uncharacterized protein YbjQ (UPF0145 family)
MNELLASTMDTVPPGWTIINVFGIVAGTEARPINPFLDGVKRLLPEHERDYPVKLANARLAAVDRMMANARMVGANAVLGVRFDHRPLSSTWVELCAYGTAVRLARLPDADPPAPRPRRAAEDDRAHNSGAG